MATVSAVSSLVILSKDTTVKAPTVTIQEKYLPIVQELEDWILEDPDREDSFEEAIRTAASHDVMELEGVNSLDDYIEFLNEYLLWVPSENVQGKQMLQRANKLYFVLNQPSVRRFQSPIAPSPDPSVPQKLTWLSDWMVRYHRTMGTYMDEPASFTPATLETFKGSPVFNMDDYLEPRGGWRCFNDWFARQHKPGRRPIAAVGDASIVASPADCRFLGAEPVTPESSVELKGLKWSIRQLLQGSEFAERFAGGTWMHAFLNVDDYHRIHAPVAGKVAEARVIPGQNFSLVGVVEEEEGEGGNGGERKKKSLTLLNEAGYQFVQTRGLVVLDMGGEAGLVAVLPVAMIAVSSVVLTAELGAQLRKGEELGFFQFGGSDVVLVFESRQNVHVTMKYGTHYKMGEKLGVLRNGS